MCQDEPNEIMSLFEGFCRMDYRATRRTHTKQLRRQRKDVTNVSSTTLTVTTLIITSISGDSEELGEPIRDHRCQG